MELGFGAPRIFWCAMVRRLTIRLYEGRRALFGAPPLVSLRTARQKRRTKEGGYYTCPRGLRKVLVRQVELPPFWG